MQIPHAQSSNLPASDRTSTPTKRQMLASVMRDVATWIVKGVPVSSSVVAKERMDLCKACEFFDHNSARCRKCGCFMNAKVHMETAACPIGKW